MNVLLGCTFVVVAVLLLTVWLGPRFLNWLIGRINAKFRRIEADRQECYQQMRAALDALERYRS